MTMSVILQHLLISLGGWAMGVTTGAALGILIALRIRALFTATPHLRRLSTLIPGRTLVLNLLIVPWTPASVLLVGLGLASVLFNTSLALFLFAATFTVSLLLERWWPSPFAVRVMAGLRTLATTSLVVAAIAGFYDGYGIGGDMGIALMTLRYEEFFQAWLILVVLVLILDVLLGIVQWVVTDRIEKGQQLQAVTQESQPAG